MRVKGYKFREGSRWNKEKAPAVGQRMKQLSAKRGELTPDAVVADAEDSESPLHSFFQWDDTKAAKEYRLEQARHLIRSVVVVYEPVKGQPAREFRAYCSLQSERADVPYRSTVEIMADKDSRALLLEQALREAKDWRNRYKVLEALSGVFAALDAVPT